MLFGITKVRYVEDEGRQLLRDFVFGGMLGPGRVPRGIDPDLVGKFVQEQLSPGSSADAYAKTADLLRFYERKEVVPHILLALTEQEMDIESIARSAYALQTAADLDPSSLSAMKTDYFDRVLVPLPSASDVFPLLLNTRVVLAPMGSLDRLAERIQADVDQAALTEYQDEMSMMAYDKIAAVQRNDLSRAKALIQKKLAIVALPQPAQRQELVAVYMGQSTAAGLVMEIWAARCLRMEALTVDAEPVRQAFAQAIDDAMAAPHDKGYQDFLVSRAAQAILYLRGVLSEKHAQRYAEVKEGAANFLWDDP